MLDLEKINNNLSAVIKAKYGTQKNFSELRGYPETNISRDKAEGRLDSLSKLNKYAEMIGISVEELVLPGLTEAEKYIKHGNFDQSRTTHSKVSNFVSNPHQAPVLNKAADPELQQKLYESQESRISLLEQMITIKDNEINALKSELNNCKNALKKQ